jgi:hypothetical protein
MISQTSVKAIRDYLDPGRTGHSRYWWPLYGQFFGACMRPPLSLVERCRVLSFIVRAMVSSRQVLMFELVRS